VREALIEREVLLAAAPHIIWPMRFVLPHSPEQRPAWLLRLGLFLYDHLGGRKKLPPTRAIDLGTDPVGEPIKDRFRRAFEYSDCWVDDSRLVILNAVDAQARGAEILIRTALLAARRDGDVWVAEVGSADGARQVRARCIVNAAGPWVEDVLDGIEGPARNRRVRLVKGSHIVTRKFWQGEHAYLLQNHDKRVIFVNPYEGDLALIGTTDIPVDGQPEDARIDEREIDYLLAVLARYFDRPPTRADIVHSFSGVRPLYDDKAANPSAVTRDYMFDIDPKLPSGATPPILSIFGGKITTYRRLAEHALDKLAPFFPGMAKAWTARAPLPGGDMPDADFDGWLAHFRKEFPWLPGDLALHYGRLYGTRAAQLLEGASRPSDLGRHFGALLYEREARFLLRTEWARSAEDILERRTKHGLHLSVSERASFEQWLLGFSGAAAPEPARAIP
jgi:glycerol-3-phosphate dehydrogenase